MTEPKVSPLPWRTGRKVHRTVYDANEKLIGVMDTREDAAHVVALNGRVDVLEKALREVAADIGREYPALARDIEDLLR